MKTIEIKLAGLLFKVWYDAESYEVSEIKRYNPLAVRGDWTSLPKSMEDHIVALLPAEVLIAKEEGLI